MSAQRNIAVFFTGGTIGMSPCAGDEAGEGVEPGGNFERLMHELGVGTGVGEYGGSIPMNLNPIVWADKPSPHMTPEDMHRLARDIDGALAREDIAGAVVLHGTDVIVESAFLCDVAVRSDKPVVFTGAMRYYTEIGYDGIRNLANAVRAAVALPRGAGTVLLMTDRIFAAREVVKINSLNVDAFGAGEAGVLGYVAGRDVVLVGACARERRVFSPQALETRVPLVTCYTGMDGAGILRELEAGARGLVLEGFGAGNVPPGALDALDRCLAAGLPVVLATRCIEGGVWPIYGYEGGGADLKARGAILCGRLGGPKARILLMLALGAGLGLDEVREIFGNL